MHTPADLERPMPATPLPFLPPGTGLLMSERPRIVNYTTTDPRAGLRRCNICKAWKPLTDFHRNASKAFGRGHECRSCKNKAA